MKHKNDYFLIGGLVLLALLAHIVFQLFSTNTHNPVCVVTVNKVEYGRYPLDEDITVPIELENGAYNILVIKDGMADITDASCPDRICVNHRKINKNGQTIVCLPNKLIVEIVNGEENEVDTTTN